MQASGGMQMGSLSVNNPVPVASSTPGMGLNSGHKHGHVDSDFYDQDQYKRPRTQAYGAADAADVDAYRRLHEVTAMVCDLQRDEVVVVIGNILCSFCLSFKGVEIVN
jgi:hypothetical protein